MCLDLVLERQQSTLAYCNATFTCVADEQIARIQKIQNNAERLVLKISKRDHTAFQITPLAPSKILHSVQARNTRFPSLRRHSSAILVFFSLHISTIALPSFFDRTTAQNSKDKLDNLRWTFFCLHCPDRLELVAGRPDGASPSLQTFKAKLKKHIFCQGF